MSNLKNNNVLVDAYSSENLTETVTHEDIARIDDTVDTVFHILTQRAWLRSQIELAKHRQQMAIDSRKGVLAKEYTFWLKNGTNVLILHILMEAFFSDRKISRADIARQSGVKRSQVTALLNEAEELGLLRDGNIPTQVTISCATEAMKRLSKQDKLVTYLMEWVFRMSIGEKKGRFDRLPSLTGQ